MLAYFPRLRGLTHVGTLNHQLLSDLHLFQLGSDDGFVDLIAVLHNSAHVETHTRTHTLHWYRSSLTLSRVH
jgi:hypothetical protein